MNWRLLGTPASPEAVLVPPDELLDEELEDELPPVPLLLLPLELLCFDVEDAPVLLDPPPPFEQPTAVNCARAAKTRALTGTRMRNPPPKLDSSSNTMPLSARTSVWSHETYLGDKLDGSRVATAATRA
jgi:hypothetical protein